MGCLTTPSHTDGHLEAPSELQLDSPNQERLQGDTRREGTLDLPELTRDASPAEAGAWDNRAIPSWDGPPLDGGIPEGHVWEKLPLMRRYAQRVVSFRPGVGASFGHEDFPAKIKGPPRGLGEAKGSLHTVSLGCGGSIVLEFSTPLVGNGPGPDFIIFENAFNPGGGKETFAEPAKISVSVDGKEWFSFPCDPKTWPHPQCAGVRPVYANPENQIDTSDPAKAGGDAYDLSQLKLPFIRFIKIEDQSDKSPDALVWCGAYNAGFDLDAVAVIWGFAPATP